MENLERKNRIQFLSDEMDKLHQHLNDYIEEYNALMNEDTKQYAIKYYKNEEDCDVVYIQTIPYDVNEIVEFKSIVVCNSDVFKNIFISTLEGYNPEIDDESAVEITEEEYFNVFNDVAFKLYLH